MNPGMVRDLLIKLEALCGEKAQIIQEIQPFDFPERQYSGIIFRLQKEPASCRLQFKRPMTDISHSRSDQEVHIFLDDPQEAEYLMHRLGFINIPKHERAILRFDVEDCHVQFNYWPGALGIYAGIEAPSQVLLDRLLKQIGIPKESSQALDGLQLFKLFGIRMETCKFSSDDKPMIREAVFGGSI